MSSEKLSRRLARLVCIAMASLAVLAAFAVWIVTRTTDQIRAAESKARVHGQLYDSIVQGKDVIADVLPPPVYIIESFLTASQLSDEADPAAREALLQKLAALRRENGERHDLWERTLPEGAVKRAIVDEAHVHATAFYTALDERFLPALAKGDLAAAKRSLRADLTPAYEAQRRSIDAVVTAATAQIDATEKELTAALAQSDRDVAAATRLAYRALGVGVGLLVLLLGVVSWRISARVTGQVGAIVRRLHSGAEEVSCAAGQVAGASQSLAEGASEQAAALEETSAALEELSGVSQRNTDHAGRANDLSTQARTAADTGATDMTAMTAAMTEIRAASNEIGKIIKTIDEIAFQTNILALNAAVEAARAGEAGLGFAVVAEEVRSLAQRSAEAARETAEKIEAAIARSEHGGRISGRVSTHLEVIVTKVREVDGLLTQVATASREQNTGVLQINRTVAQMDGVVQRNAAAAEEGAGAAVELARQVDVLKGVAVELSALVGSVSREPVGKPAREATARQVKPQPVPAAQAPGGNPPGRSAASTRRALAVAPG